MNWFDILKEQTSVQSSRSGMAPIDIQKPFKRVKEEDDCFEQLKKYISSFFGGASPKKLDFGGRLDNFEWKNDEDAAFITKGNNRPVPDEFFCRGKKWIEEKLANHDKNVEYKDSDSELLYYFHTVYEPEIFSSHKSGGYFFKATIQIKGGVVGQFPQYFCIIEKQIKGEESS